MIENIIIKYRIIEMNDKEQSIVVRYYTDLLSEEALAADSNRNPDGIPVRCRTDFSMNLYDADYVKDEESLHKFLLDAAPTDWFRLQHESILGIEKRSIDFVKPHFNKTYEKTVELKKPELIKIEEKLPETLTDEEIDKLIEQLSANT